MAASPAAHSDNSSQISAGPVSAAEAQVLWQDGKGAFDQGKDQDAIPKLERLVARYPGYAQYLEAKHTLARAYLRQHQPQKAKNELEGFLQTQSTAQSKSLDSIQARLELTRSDLELGQYHEAALTAEEVIKLTAKPEQGEQRAEALGLRARAQIGLGEDARAQTSLGSAQKALPAPAPSGLVGELKSVELELALRECERFPSAKNLEEDQVRDQLSRRGTCLLNALLVFKQVLQTHNDAASNEDSKRIMQAYDSYWLKCTHPPAPPVDHAKKRTEKQLKTYFRELAVVLEEDCHLKIRQGIQLIAGWKESVSVSAAESLSRTAAALENIR